MRHGMGGGRMKMSTNHYQERQPSVVISTSSPGKALICGGYLVLESPNIGLVVAVDSRFHATVGIINQHKEHKNQPENSLMSNSDCHYVKIDVHSPQFLSVLQYFLVYHGHASDGSDCTCSSGLPNNKPPIQIIPRTSQQKSNPFVEKTLAVTFTFIRGSMLPSSFHNFLMSLFNENKEDEAVLAIKLRADNDFYSQIHSLQERHLELTPQNAALLPAFLPPTLPVRKTGLGSSAALVTSLVGSLLRFFNLVVLPTTKLPSSCDSGMDDEQQNLLLLQRQQQEGLRITHNLSQICHCWAQGKIGSGFDISSAIYGSQVYSRFKPDALLNLLVQHEEADNSNDDGQLLVNLFQDSSSSLWDASVTPLVLPKGLELIMADVCGGSESPSMATKIMSWRKKAAENDANNDIELWNTLVHINKQIQQTLQSLVDVEDTLCDSTKRNAWNLLKDVSVDQWATIASPSTSDEDTAVAVSMLAQSLVELRLLFLKTRSLLKTMGEMAGVPVEPDSQTVLANSTMEIPGVVAAGVPGAGGQDALFVLYIKGVVNYGDNDTNDVVRNRIGNLWKGWSTTSISGETQEDGSFTKVLICPLTVRYASYGDGLFETNLAW